MEYYKSKFSGKEVDEKLGKVDELDSAIIYLQNNKIEKENDDYYPNMSVGLADNLAGNDVVDGTFSFRRSGGGAIADGNARIEAIKGNSVVWNQKVRNVLDTTGAEGWWNRGQTQLSVDGNKIVMATGESGMTQMSQMVGFAVGHKYLVGFDVKVATNLADFYLDIIQSSNLYGNQQKKIGGVTQKEAQFATIYTADADMPYLSIFHNVTLNEGDITTLNGIKVIDLTLMFGVGNEPTTIEEAYARMPIGVDLNAYNEGTIIDTTANSIVSRGFNQWDGEWEQGTISGETGENQNSSSYWRTKNFIPIIPNEEYIIVSNKNRAFMRARFYDVNKVFLGIEDAHKKDVYENQSFKVPSNAHYLRFAPDPNYLSHEGLIVHLANTSHIASQNESYISRVQSLSIVQRYFPGGMRSAGNAHDEIRYNKATQKWEKVQRIAEVDMGDLDWEYISNDYLSLEWRYL